MKIVGLYTAPSTTMNLAADSNITQALAKVADKIKQFYDDAFIFVVRPLAPLKSPHGLVSLIPSFLTLGRLAPLTLPLGP